MSDLHKRNVDTMIAESKRMHAEVEAMRGELRAVNTKIASLTTELTELKRVQIMESVRARVALTGSGGTADGD